MALEPLELEEDGVKEAANRNEGKKREEWETHVSTPTGTVVLICAIFVVIAIGLVCVGVFILPRRKDATLWQSAASRACNSVVTGVLSGSFFYCSGRKFSCFSKIAQWPLAGDLGSFVQKLLGQD